MKLDEWISRECKCVKKWCESIGITTATYYSILRGSDIRVSIAKKIIKSTKGAVTFEDLLSYGESRNDDREKKDSNG